MPGYVKITFEDIEIAKNFFENEKHLDEFLINVCKYYCGYDNVFKYKNVKKFFETYKKTMDRVIVGRSTGSIGGRKRAENQQDTTVTLQGVLEGGIEVPLLPKETKEINLTKETETEEDTSKRSSDTLLFEIEQNKNQKMEGFNTEGCSSDFIKYFGIANGFRKIIMDKVKFNGGSVEKLKDARIGAWVKPIRDMYVIDKIGGKSVESVYKWLPTSDFWSKNILSTHNLRDKFNKLAAEAKNSKPDTSKSIYG